MVKNTATHKLNESIHNLARIIENYDTPHQKTKNFHTIMLLKIEA